MSKQDQPPKRNSAEGRSLEKIVHKTPFLKKMRAQSHGEKYNEIVSSDNSQQYKDNWDKIQWTKPEHKEKPKFRVKINGVLQYPEDDNDN